MQAELVAVTGPIRGAVFRLQDEDVSIGRHDSNQLCIADPSVSRRHSIIKADAEAYRIVDAGSNNGTYVNGRPVTEHVLKSGDTIAIGDTVLRFANVDPSDSECRVVIPGDREELLSLSTVRLVAPAGADRPGATADRNAVAAVTRVLDAELSLDELSKGLFDAFDPLLSADSGAVLLVGAPGEPPLTLQWSNRAAGPVRILPAVVERTLAGGEPLLTTESGACEMAVPLAVRGNILGLIYFCRRPGTGGFDASHLALVRMLSGHIALALNAARRAGENGAGDTKPETPRDTAPEIVGDGPRMRALRQRLKRVAVSDATVLVLGETGTGKELAARAIHAESSRAARPFEAINCALLKDSLLESELFGHEKGAFTGAVSQRRGRFERADRGTIFLDEIGELPESTQAMLLRVLQEQSFHRLGGERVIHVDVRVIAATHRDLEEAIRDGVFRSDLYYRLNVVSVLLPPLRDRREDIPLLAERFLRRCAAKNRRFVRTISPAAMTCLEEYDWPGNVRELENAIEYAIVFGYSSEIQTDDLPERVAAITSPRDAATSLEEPAASGLLDEQLRSLKTQLVLEALEKSHGNYTKAAKLLGVHPNNLHRLARSLDLRPGYRQT